MPTITKKKNAELINIVPVHEATIPTETQTTPKLMYNGGPLISSVEICPIFWGDAWNNPSQRIISQYIFLFFQNIVTSSFLTQLREYSTPSYKIKLGSVTNIFNIPHTFSIPIVLDVSIQTMLKQKVTEGTLPQPNSNRLYFVYLPPGLVVQKGLGVSCINFCGYHDYIAPSIYYAIVPYVNCKACLNGLSINDALTSISSHELAEAITDPIPGKGWYDNNYGEIGDICAWKTTKLPNTNYLIQQEWSNKQNACAI